jgi:PAS domain S-box-containing protein
MGVLDVTLPAGAAPPEPAQPASPEEAMAVLGWLAGALDTAHLAGRDLGPLPPVAGRGDAADVSASRLRQVEARFRAMVEQMPAVTFLAALDGGLNELYVSPQIEAMLGYTQREWLSDPVLWFRRLHPDDRALWSQEFARGCATGGPFRAECRFVARDGSIVWVRGEARIDRDARGRPLFLQGLAYDITESKRAEQTIKASLREKETLLKEVHHRVKNNLQIISSLLRLQSSRLTDEVTRSAFLEAQGRIRAIALVHELLYRSTDLSLIDFAEYARRLVEQLSRTYGQRSPAISVATEIDEVRLAIDSAVPCGLLISELVSNCFKHAFPGERSGSIVVRFRVTDRACELEVRDDGAGFPPAPDPASASSLGLELVRTLTRQLHGALELSTSPDTGTAFHVTLPRSVARPPEHGSP